jgi:hypothetical protein
MPADRQNFDPLDKLWDTQVTSKGQCSVISAKMYQDMLLEFSRGLRAFVVDYLTAFRHILDNGKIPQQMDARTSVYRGSG